MLEIIHALLCDFNFPRGRLLRLFYKAMQEHDGIRLPGEIENAGDVRGKTNSQFPNIAFDMLDIGLFQGIAEFYQQVYFMESLGSMLGWQTIQKVCYRFITIRSGVKFYFSYWISPPCKACWLALHYYYIGYDMKCQYHI